MTAGDRAVERAAQKLESVAQRAAVAGGLKAKLAPELAEDAAFLRKLKPSLVAARMRGDAAAENEPASGGTPPSAPKKRKPARKKKDGSGRSPIVIAACGLVVGMTLAKMLDWRGHAHPRR